MISVYDLFPNLTYDITDKLQEFYFALTPDFSGMVYVDGEEADYGIIRWVNKNNILIAEQHVLAGDDSYWKFTAEGKRILIAMLTEVIYNMEIDTIGG